MKDEFDSLEKALDDWEKMKDEYDEECIQKITEKRKEENKKRNNPLLPRFDVFMKVIHELSSGNYSQMDWLRHVASRLLAREATNLPKSFRHIWDYFVGGVCAKAYPCSSCNKEFEVLYEPYKIFAEPYDRRYDDDMFGRNTVELDQKHSMCMCPNCGRSIFYVTGKIVGILDRRGVYDSQ